MKLSLSFIIAIIGIVISPVNFAENKPDILNSNANNFPPSSENNQKIPSSDEKQVSSEKR
jgi:hypothetical protein